MIIYKWKIKQLKRSIPDDYVKEVDYIVEAIDGKYTQVIYGNVSFDKETNVSSTPFNALTETLVISWVKSKISPSDVEAQLADKVNLLKTPISAVGMPWEVAED